MPNLGFTEVMILLVVALLVFGAKRLPEIGSSMGKGIREFQRSIKGTQDAVMGGDDASSHGALDRGAQASSDNTPAGGEPKRLSQ
jgi:sec-independent protein translocase protein TatA